MQEENYYFIAELGVEKSDIVERCIKPMNVFDASFDAIEVFTTPFEAIRALNQTVKLIPEYHVTIFATDTENVASITISNNSESKTLIKPIIGDKVYLKKYYTMALGSLIYSL